MKKEAKALLVSFSSATTLTLIILVFFFVSYATASNSGNSENASLTIWARGTPNSQNLTFGIYTGKNSNHWDFIFYTNYTNSSGAVLNQTVGNANCSIRFNETGTWRNWVGMSFNNSNLLWGSITNFTYKGNITYHVNCTSSYGNITNLTEIIFVKNTPLLSYGLGPYNPLFSEDNYSSYNLNETFSDDDRNDVFTYAILNISSDSYPNATSPDFYFWISVNSSGFLISNSTFDNQSGSYGVSVLITDGGNDGSNKQSVVSLINLQINSLNDAPIFTNLQNKSFNITELFQYIIYVTDEENNTPFKYNITFLNCTVAPWSTRNCSTAAGRELFNSSQYTTNNISGIINISFTPVKNDVGNYIINFTVIDSGISSPANASKSQIVNFTVLNINSPPYFTYVCDNERNATEDSEFTCYVNVTDLDELNNLTLIVVNYDWFKFNGSGTNQITVITSGSTNFSASALVNFTPVDSNVGNWTINITARDTSIPSRTNSSIFSFFIANINDSVSLGVIPNVPAYTTNNYTRYVNATDDDLLIPDKSVYNETLTFNSNNSNVLLNSLYISGTNKTRVAISFDPNVLGGGNHTVNISVHDANNHSRDSKVFTISVISNNAPVWQSNIVTEFNLTEDVNFYLNLSQNVTDAENDAINFSYSSSNSFPSLSVSSTGIINFTPIDEDVGFHVVTINASDYAIPTPKQFNFTVNNINDRPNITSPITVVNATGNNVIGINASEDNYTTINLFIVDDDFKIPVAQRSYYNESINLTINITGANSRLFNFTKNSNPPSGQARFDATFTPTKSDAGSYRISINASDLSNSSDFISFNLTVFAINHYPSITQMSNQTSSVNRTLYVDINATDTEDGNEQSNNLTFRYSFLSGTDFIGGNLSIFNKTSGVLNITFNATQGGKYNLNISVNDTSGLTNAADFWVFVYDAPIILYPSSLFVFNLSENNQSNLTFRANHSVGDNLTYMLYIAGNLRYNASLQSNGSANLTWAFTPNYTDETYGNYTTIKLIAMSSYFADVNSSTTWNMNISHTNYPITFSGYIGDRQATYSQTITISLSSYFSDIDYDDKNYNQSVNFSISSNQTPSRISYSVPNWVLNLSATTATRELINITASDLNSSGSVLTSAYSNNFIVEFTTPSTTSTPSSGGGGGGGGTTTTKQKPLSLKIIVPGAVSAKKKDKIVVPVSVENGGEIDLSEIILDGTIAKDGLLRKDLIASFDRSFISFLPAGAKENITLIVDIDTNATGLFDVTINGTVKSPKYSDWGKFVIQIKEEETLQERIIFAEEFIVGNPECAELKEIVDEAKEFFDKGDFDYARKKVDEALDACKKAISQPVSARVYVRMQENILGLAGALTLLAFVVGFFVYYYKRRKLARMGRV